MHKIDIVYRIFYVDLGFYNVTAIFSRIQTAEAGSGNPSSRYYSSANKTVKQNCVAPSLTKVLSSPMAAKRHSPADGHFGRFR